MAQSQARLTLVHSSSTTANSESEGTYRAEIGDAPAKHLRATPVEMDVAGFYPLEGPTVQLAEAIDDARQAFDDALASNDPLVMDDRAVACSLRLLKIIELDQGGVGMIAGAIYETLLEARDGLLDRDHISAIKELLEELRSKPRLGEELAADKILELQDAGILVE